MQQRLPEGRVRQKWGGNQIENCEVEAIRVPDSALDVPFDVQYALDYHDYRRADVTSTIRIPEPQ